MSKDEKKKQTKIRPLGNRVLVERDKEDEKTDGGIIIPEVARKAKTWGVVVATGPGKVLESGRRQEPGVGRGAHVLFSKYAGTELEDEGVTRIMLTEDDIDAVEER